MVNLDGGTAYRAEPMVPPRGALILSHEIRGLMPHMGTFARVPRDAPRQGPTLGRMRPEAAR